MLAERKVLGSEERLHVSSAFQDDPEIFSWLYNAFMTVLRFKEILHYSLDHCWVQLQDTDCCSLSLSWTQALAQDVHG